MQPQRIPSFMLLHKVMQAHVVGAETHLRHDSILEQRHQLSPPVQDECQAVRVAREHLQLHVLLGQQLRLRMSGRKVAVVSNLACSMTAHDMDV